MKWSIMVLTQPSREGYLYRLLLSLKPQVEAYSDQVELMIRECDYFLPVGDNRQIMRETCTGQYSNFIDDDDIVPSNYVETLLPLMDGVDYIGHDLERYDDGHYTDTYIHSLENGISHINPIRTELALKGSMYGGFGEDRRWWNRLAELDCVKTEHYVPKTMYKYMYRSNKGDGPPKDNYYTDPQYDNH
jgi:hypothetical protein